MIQLPTNPIRADWPVRVVLEGTRYILRWHWHQRAYAWHLDLGLPDGTWISQGTRLVPRWPLFHDLQHADKPPGFFVVIDRTPDAGELGRYDLGERLIVVYYRSTEIQAVVPESEIVRIEILP